MRNPFYLNKSIQDMQTRASASDLKYSLFCLLIRGYLTISKQNKPVIRERIKVEWVFWEVMYLPQIYNMIETNSDKSVLEEFMIELLLEELLE